MRRSVERLGLSVLGLKKFMYVKSYKQLYVWQRSIELVKEIYKLTDQMPKSELYGLMAQMRRAAISIPSNIVEGYKRKNLREYLQFLYIADASAAELETQLISGKELYKTIDYSHAEALLEEVQKMLAVVIRKLNAKRRSLNAMPRRVLLSMILTTISFFLWGNFTTAKEVIPAPTIVINPDIYYPLDEILYMEGRARATSNIQIQFQKQGVKPVTVNTRSDANGEWVLAEKVPLEAGNWEVRARVVESTGQASDWSNPRVIKAIQTGIIIGGITVKFAALIFALLLILSIGTALIIYFSWRVKRLRARVTYLRTRQLEKELAEKTAALERALLEKGKEVASTVVEEGFEELKQSILGEIEHLEKRADGRPLTAEEEEHKKLLLAKLKEIEEKIERKIKEVRLQ